MKPESNTIICGDTLETLKTWDDEFVDCVVTSPPYWGLRDYGVEGQIGLEKTPEEYVAKMVKIFREIKRVLKKDGTCWLNLGDSYASCKSRYSIKAQTLEGGGEKEEKYGSMHNGNKPDLYYHPFLKDKDLVGIPWRVAFALQADGWYLRQDIIWAKPNPMPESVTDRCTKSHEYIFLLTKNAKYYFDQKAISEPAKQVSIDRLSRAISNQNKWINGPDGQTKHTLNQPRQNRHTKIPIEIAEQMGSPRARYKRYEKSNAPHSFEGSDHLVASWKENVNKRSVWTVSTKPYSEAHFATFPPDLIIPPIKTTRPNTLILDPFMGSGTTAYVSRMLGRNYLGIELNPEYIKLANKRLSQQVLL